MADNDFKGESPLNYTEKILCVLVLDVSTSMVGNPIDMLNKGLQDFYKIIENDPLISQMLEVSLISFNNRVNVEQAPALVADFTLPRLFAEAVGSDAMVDAIKEAIGLVAARKEWYKENGQTYYRPWIILMCKCDLDDYQDVIGLSNTIKADSVEKKYYFQPISIDGKNMSILNQIANPTMPVQKLSDTTFSDIIKWSEPDLDVCLMINSEEEQQINLPDFSEWLESFTIE